MTRFLHWPKPRETVAAASPDYPFWRVLGCQMSIGGGLSDLSAGEEKGFSPRCRARRSRHNPVSVQCVTHLSVLSSFTGTHFDESRVEAAKHFDQVGLRSHHLRDVLVNAGHFVKACGEERHLALCE